MSQLRFASPQEEKADRLIDARLVTLGQIERNQGRRVISGSVLDNARTEQVNLVINEDDRLVEARCTCHFYGHNKMMRGPCEHMLRACAAFSTRKSKASRQDQDARSGACAT